MESEIFRQDLNYIAESNLPFIDFHNKTFVITGATGLVGSLLVKALLYCNEKKGLNLKVVAVVRNRNKAEKIFSDYMDSEGLSFIEQDLMEPLCSFPAKIDFIVHAAAVTASAEMISHPVENIHTSIRGTMSILELARDRHVKGMVYLSSMEVYGKLNVSDHLITEEELGEIDLSSARSCYPEGKRMCECLCNAYVHQYGLNIKAARLAQTFGAGIPKEENRVFAQFAKSALQNSDIVLRTHGLSEGNYIYTRDAVVAILLLLFKGEPGAYNVVNESSHTTIAQMAQMVATEIAENRIRVVYDIPEDIASTGYAPDVKMHLSSKKLETLGWAPSVGLKEAYQRMIESMEAYWR